MSKKKKQDESFELMEWKRYKFKLDEKEKAYIRQFYREYYKADFYGDTDNHIIEGGSMKKEAIHNHNAKNNDAINQMSLQDPYLDRETKEFMEDASDDWEWMDTYKVLGYPYAIDQILNQTLTNLDNKFINKKHTLIKYHIKMDKLRILNNKQKIIDREKK